MTYHLNDDGDAIERQWVVAVAANFQNYEPFWVKYVVPITWRVVDRNCLYVRHAAPKALKKLATSNYGTFLHLAQCHAELDLARQNNSGGGQLFARVGIYNFYGRLSSAGDMVEDFLGAVKEVVDKYQGRHGSDLKARLGSHSSGDLFLRYDEAFKTRTTDYRHPQVHNWGFPAIGGLIPRRAHLKEWKDKDLGTLEKYLSMGDCEGRIRAEFVDAVTQAGDDLLFAETVINDIWQVGLDELHTMTQISRYRADQDRGRNGIPPQRPRSVSAMSAPVSGAI